MACICVDASAIDIDCTAPLLTVPPAVAPSGGLKPIGGPPRPDATGFEAPPAVAAERCPAVGDTLRGRYRVVAVIGRGGMGTIFEVDDLYLSGIAASDRRLAVKMLRNEVIRRPDLLRELLAEFLNSRSLSHPNILRVHDFDHDGGQAFFTMELLHGTSLGNVISGRGTTPLALDHARAIVHAVGMALAHAHSRGIVHGDITPQNIFLTRDGDVRILDFGASRRLVGEPAITDEAGTGEAPIQPRLMATQRYASCEVLEGRTAEITDDVFGLASVGYELFTGKHPFGNRTAVEARADERKPVRPRGLSARQWRILRRGLDLRHDRRPSEIGRWVRRLNSGSAVRSLPMLCDLFTVRPARRGPRTVAAAAAALLLFAAGGYGWHGHQASLQSLATTTRADAAAVLVTVQDHVRALLE